MEKNKVLLVFVILASIGLLACAGINIYLINNLVPDVYEFIYAYSLVATSIFAVYYMVSGCKKEEGSTFFKIFMGLFALASLVNLFGNESILVKVTSIISAILLIFLALVKDFGKRNSLIVASIILVTVVLKALNLNSEGAFVSRPLTFILLAIVTIIMIFAKYQDKANRNSK